MYRNCRHCRLPHAAWMSYCPSCGAAVRTGTDSALTTTRTGIPWIEFDCEGLRGVDVVDWLKRHFLAGDLDRVEALYMATRALVGALGSRELKPHADAVPGVAELVRFVRGLTEKPSGVV